MGKLTRNRVLRDIAGAQRGRDESIKISRHAGRDRDGSKTKPCGTGVKTLSFELAPVPLPSLLRLSRLIIIGEED